MTGDEVLKLIDYPSYFDLMKIPLPDNRSLIFEKLMQEKLIVENRDNYDITNLGAILFAKELDAFETLSESILETMGLLKSLYHWRIFSLAVLPKNVFKS